MVRCESINQQASISMTDVQERYTAVLMVSVVAS